MKGNIIIRALKAIGKYILTTLLFTIIFLSVSLPLVGYVWKEFIAFQDEMLKGFDIASFEYQPSLITRIYSKNGTLLAEIYDEKRNYLPYNKIPEDMINAVIATEDRRFYEHYGIDLIGIIRAVVYNFSTGNPTGQGASTITQQLSRTLFLSQEKSWERKIKEALISVELEKKFDKNKILEMYLNEIFYGHNAYGLEAAAKTFYGKSVNELSMDQITLLAGLPQGPSIYNPKKYPEKAQKRRLAVLDAMVREGYLTAEEAKKIAETPVEVVNTTQDEKRIYNMLYPYYTSWVISDLEKKFGERIYSAGWDIYTTLVDEAQEMAEAIAAEQSEKFAKQYNANDIAIVTIDPQTGALVAMAGGGDFLRNQVNMAVKPRQPGSSIKPLIYAAGIEEGLFTDSNIYLDEPTNIGGYAPRNYNRKHVGYITIREAVRVSNNVVAVKAANDIGIRTIRNYLQKMGITSLTDSDMGLGIAIGGLSKGISPYEMATAYGIFANKGVLVTPHYIEKIANRKGTVVYKPEIKQERIISEETANIVAHMLYENVQMGTGSRAQIGRHAAGKTGTTDNVKDLWFVGFTPNASTAVWVGNSDNSSPKGNPSSGSTAGGVWGTYMKQYASLIPNKSFDFNYGFQEVKLYLTPNTPPMLAGPLCMNNPLEENLPEYQRSYVVKTLRLRTGQIPTETFNCEPLNMEDYIEEYIELAKEDKGVLDTLVSNGYAGQLIQKGLLPLLIENNYLGKLVENGYTDILIKEGYFDLLVEKGYIKPNYTPDNGDNNNNNDNNEIIDDNRNNNGNGNHNGNNGNNNNGSQNGNNNNNDNNNNEQGNENNEETEENEDNDESNVNEPTT